MTTSLSDFPSFTSERQLFKALRQQGFSVDRRGPGYKVEGRGGMVFIHSGSITDRSGARSKNVLKELVNIGFQPPSEFKREAKAEVRAQMDQPKNLGLEGEAVPTEAPADTEDPTRAFACELCAVERCRKCIDKELPCAWARNVHLRRHMTTIHAEPGVSDKAYTRPKQPRSSRVRTRVDPDVIPNIVGRRIARLKRLLAETVLEMDELLEEAEKLRTENNQLRKMKKEADDLANRFYDLQTKPRG